MAVLRNGDIQITIKKHEVKWMLGWVDSIIEAEKDAVSSGDVPKEFLFYAEKLKFLLKGGNLERSRFSRKRQTETCPKCEGEYVYLHRHVCNGHNEHNEQQEIDQEILMRI